MNFFLPVDKQTDVGLFCATDFSSYSEQSIDNTSDQ